MVPKLRFKEFDDVWVSRKMGEVGTFVGGGTPSTQNLEYWSGDIPWVSSSDLTDESIYQINKTRFITEGAISNSATKLIPSKSILIVSRVGVGKLAVNEYEICTSQDFTSLIPLSDNPFFLAYLLKFKTNKLLDLNQGTSIKGFVKSDLETLTIHLPTLPEQQKIAQFLSATDQKITLLKRKKQLLETYKKGVMQKIFSQELRFKDDEGADFAEWEVRRLGEVAPLQRGFDLPVDTIVEGEYPVVFSNGILKFHNEFKVKSPGVVTGRSGTIGKVTFVEKDYWPHNTTLWVTDFKGNSPKFIYHFYSQFKLEHLGTGSGVPTLNRNDVHIQEIHLPTFPEQKKIANYLTALDEKISKVQEQIAQMVEWKKGLMQKMFV
jgi:type I restriction enzyme, S subunit